MTVLLFNFMHNISQKYCFTCFSFFQKGNARKPTYTAALNEVFEILN